MKPSSIHTKEEAVFGKLVYAPELRRESDRSGAEEK
jgi:hypothetical protein